MEKKVTVVDSEGRVIDYALAEHMMDDDIREMLHNDMAPCTAQEFFDAYVQAHADEFGGEEFDCSDAVVYGE